MRNLLFFIFLILSTFSWSQEDSCIICFSHPSGFYKKSFNLTLTTNDSVDLFYTTDGSKPNSSSTKYKSPILIDTVKAFRVIAYQKGRSIDQETQTYFVNRDFSMGVISIITNSDNLFGYDRGIYVKGCCAGETPPYSGANFWRGWEREVNIEFFEQNGELAFSQKAGVKIFGGFSKSLPMKSISLTSRKKYEKKYFKYQLFPDKKIKIFKSFVLRNSGGDFNKTHFRDALLTNLVEPLDLEIQAYRPVVVYINGEYWGIHNLREKLTEHYLEANGKANPDKVDLMKHRNDLQHGNRTQYKALIKFLSKTDLSDTTKVYELAQQMDIDNFIDYNITQIFIDNRDAGGNIRYWKPQNNDSKWRWILFDTDMSFGISDWKGYKTNTLKKMTSRNTEAWPNPAWSTFIVRKLLENDSLKHVYINRFSDHLNTIFTTGNVLFKLDSIKSMLNEEMPYHVTKWRSNNLKRWERNVGILRDFANYRPTYMRQFLMEQFELTDTLVVEVIPTDKRMGKVYLNSLKIKQPFKGYYFKEVPIRLKAKPNFGYEFIEWKGIHKTSKTLDYSLSKNIEIEPIFKQKDASQWKQKVILNELCLKSDSSNLMKDWVEIYNNSDTTIDISNWELIIEKEYLKISKNVILQPNQYYVIARQPNLLNKYSNISDILLPRGLPSKKGFIALLDNKSAVVDSFSYNVKKNFKTDTILLPIILEKVNPNQFSNVANWNINNQPTIGERNRAFKEYKPIKVNLIAQYWKLLLGVVAGLSLFLLIILSLRRKKLKKTE